MNEEDWPDVQYLRALPQQSPQWNKFSEEVPLVSSRFAVITESANLEFRAFLGHGLSRTNGALEHRQIEDLIKLEASWAASGVGHGSTCSFS